jgi:hypothetical protein
MVETCKRIPKPDFIQACDKALNTGGALHRIWKRMMKSTYPAWFRPFAELEAIASAFFEYESQAMPGLLQTEDYARAILRAGRPRDTDEQIERHVAARMARQTILTRDDPPLLWVVLDEAALRRPVGGREVMRSQRSGDERRRRACGRSANKRPNTAYVSRRAYSCVASWAGRPP